MVYFEQNWFHYKPITFLYIGDKKKGGLWCQLSQESACYANIILIPGTQIRKGEQGSVFKFPALGR